MSAITNPATPDDWPDWIQHYDPEWAEYIRTIEHGHEPTTEAAEQARRGLRAMQLAPNIYVYEALLAGEGVPPGALDQYWAKKYGLA